MPGIIVKIDASDQSHLYKTNKFLRKYLGQNFDVKLNKQGGHIELNPINGNGGVEDIEIAMAKYVKSLGTGHGGCRFRYDINCLEISERDKIYKEVQKEFDEKDQKRIEQLTYLETKLQEENVRHKNYVETMNDEKKDLGGKIHILKQEIDDFEKIQENLVSDLEQITELKTMLEIQNGSIGKELESVRDEYLGYKERPVYKIIFDKLKELVNK
ncbi:MAG: hypothetical protein KJ906_04170 [Nanoarchaeota archaeon]|nr:hypothetical protein [Nanoarchaeota archaeon]